MPQDTQHAEEQLQWPPWCVTVRAVACSSSQAGQEPFIPHCSLRPPQVVRLELEQENKCCSLSVSLCVFSSSNPSFIRSLALKRVLAYCSREDYCNTRFVLGVSSPPCSLLSDSAPSERWRLAAHFLLEPQLKPRLGRISVCRAELQPDPAWEPPNPHPQNHSLRGQSQTRLQPAASAQRV